MTRLGEDRILGADREELVVEQGSLFLSLLSGS